MSDQIREAIVDLIEFVPELTKPSDYAEFAGVPKEFLEDGDGSPFLSESFLYGALGKDDARSVLGRLSRLIKLLGYEDLAMRVY